MLAIRDQENLTYTQQAAGAAKSLNQGTRQLPPKTPSNKAPKTPFKLPLKDENGNGGLGAGKDGLRTAARNNENALAGKKGGFSGPNAFVTPVAPKNRAPLGMKTTNAKIKAFQTPAPIKESGGEEKNQKSVSARKAKPRVSHAEMTKLDMLGDHEALEERDVEYMPPNPKDLQDIPDDIPPLDFSILKDYNPMISVLNKPGWDGLSILERQEREQAERDDRSIRKAEAAMLRDIESMSVECFHSPDCPGEVCRDTLERTDAAEKKYQRTVAAIEAEEVPAWRKILEKEGPTIMPKHLTTSLSKPKTSNAVAKPTSKAPATSKKPLPPSAKAHLKNTNLAYRPQNRVLPSNPSPMRHSAALAASKTTMGYSKGRKTSATLRKSVLPGKENAREIPDTTLAPAEYLSRYGVPRVGTDIWFRCKSAGCFDEEEGPSLEELMGLDKEDAFFRDEAEQDFVLALPD